MENLQLETLQALAEVPLQVLRELKEMPVGVLRALRDVPAEVIQSLQSGSPEGTAGIRTCPRSEPGSAAGELHLAFEHVNELVQAADLNVVGSIGKYRGEKGSQGWINIFSDSGGGGVDSLLNTPVYKVAEALSVLGNEVRLSILRSLFDAPKSAAELVAALGMGTTGQAYHHLRELEGINAVEAQDGKYRFNSSFTRVYLTALLVAAEAGHAGPYDKQGASEAGGPDRK